MKRRCASAALLVLLGAAPLPPPLYAGQAMVTGTDDRDRPRGLAQCLDEVLVKVSGDPNIVNRPGMVALRRQAAGMLRDIGYHDRMTGLPHHDEQGSRDRPFVLTADFDPGKIAAALAGLGETPWNGTRPPVLLLVQVHGYSGNFAITQTEPAAALMREAIDDAATRYGLAVTLPAQPSVVPPAQPSVAPPAQPSVAPPAPGALPGAIVVQGTLDWSDAAFGWVVRWQTDVGSKTLAWGERGVSFDEAFRDAMAGALGAASGHGLPRPAPTH